MRAKRAWGVGRVVVGTSILLCACVTNGRSPVDERVTGYCAPPLPVVAFADEDGLPHLYDEALADYVPDGPETGAAMRFVEIALADGLVAGLDGRFAGGADCTLDVRVLNVILPDATRYTPLSGQKSFLVAATLTGSDGTVLVETRRPFTILSDFQYSKYRTGSAWMRIGNTRNLRAEALVTLTDASAAVIADAFAGGRTQTGLSGRLVAYPDRVPSR